MDIKTGIPCHYKSLNYSIYGHIKAQLLLAVAKMILGLLYDSHMSHNGEEKMSVRIDRIVARTIIEMMIKHEW